jgi:hypothetical protein
MELSPSSDAASCAAIQKFPQILWNLKFHYRIHKISPPTGPYPEPDQSSSYHTVLFQIHWNIIQSPTPWSS